METSAIKTRTIQFQLFEGYIECLDSLIGALDNCLTYGLNKGRLWMMWILENYLGVIVRSDGSAGCVIVVLVVVMGRLVVVLLMIAIFGWRVD